MASDRSAAASRAHEDIDAREGKQQITPRRRNRRMRRLRDGDPFAGSGTTGVAALRQGRRFAGWEMNPEYAEMARCRLAAAREQLEIGF
jgi:hypothetical protein